MDTIQNAIEIAKTDLRSCYSERGILTGSRGVYWSWDSYFASFGSLAIGDDEIVKKNLLLYLSQQNSKGNIPKRVANPMYPLRYIGIPIDESPKKQRASFASPYYTGISLSQCPVFIIAFHEYIKETNDRLFLKDHFLKLVKVLDFLKLNTYRNGLIKESLGGGWAESVLKRGAVAYTNICYARSLECMSIMSRKLNHQDIAEAYKLEHKKILNVLDKSLWSQNDGGFYSDWIGLSRHHYFASDSNLLSIWWDIANKDQKRCIEKHLDIMLDKSDLPLPLTLDRYYFWRIFVANQLGGIKNYHVGFSWIWLGCLAVLTKINMNKKAESLQILTKLAQAIVKHGGIFEIYNHGKPVSLPFYKSEKPWAWSSGLFLHCCKELNLL